MAATIEPGTSSKEAQDLQKRLVKFGYSVPTDGSMDDRTMKAVNDLSGRIGYNSSLKTVDAGFLKALAAFEKKKFHKIKLCGTLYVVDDEELEKLKKAFAPMLRNRSSPMSRWPKRCSRSGRRMTTPAATTGSGPLSSKRPPASASPKSVADGALKSAENLKSAARNLRLTKSLYATETNNIRKAFATIDQYRDELFIGAEGLVVQLQAIEQSCVVTLEISAALATGGASVQAQIALSMAVAGYAQALKEVETASVQANYKVIDGLGRIAFSAGIDGVCNMILKGPKGKAVLDGIEKAALKEASPMLKTYIVKGIRGGGEKMIEDGIKGLGSLLTDPSKKLTLEEVIKAAVASFVTGMSVGILDKTAAKWGKSASKNFYAKDFEVFGKNVELDKAGEEAIKKTIEKVAGGIAESVISNWDPKKDANKAYDAIKAAVLGDSRVKATAKKYAKKK
ncbi:peptidoglycan-binding protein [Seohaeicola zhoushanensis]